MSERDEFIYDGVGSDELVKYFLEFKLLLLLQEPKPLYGGVEQGVDLPVVLRSFDLQQQCHRGLDLFWPEHIEVIEAAASIEQQVRITGGSNGSPVIGLERLHDVLGLVAEVEHERLL